MGRTCLGCRLGRLVACVPLARTRPTTRTARGAAVPRCQILPHTNEKSQASQKRYLTFLAGAEGLEPSARGFGVDVGERSREQVWAGVAPSYQPSRQKAVLFWCFVRNPTKIFVKSAPLNLTSFVLRINSWIAFANQGMPTWMHFRTRLWDTVRLS